jgi:hypothetical protein
MLRGVLQMERDVERGGVSFCGYSVIGSCVNFELLSPCLLQVSLQACAEETHNVRAGAVLLLARTMLPTILRPRKEEPWIDPPHISFALLISPLPGHLPTFRSSLLAIRSYTCSDNHVITLVTDKCFDLSVVRRRELERDATISGKEKL